MAAIEADLRPDQRSRRIRGLSLPLLGATRQRSAIEIWGSCGCALSSSPSRRDDDCDTGPRRKQDSCAFFWVVRRLDRAISVGFGVAAACLCPEADTFPGTWMNRRSHRYARGVRCGLFQFGGCYGPQKTSDCPFRSTEMYSIESCSMRMTCVLHIDTTRCALSSVQSPRFLYS